MSETQPNLIYRSEALFSFRELAAAYVPGSLAVIIGELYFIDWVQTLFSCTLVAGLFIVAATLLVQLKWPESNLHRYVWAIFCLVVLYVGIDKHDLYLLAPIIGTIMVLFLPARSALFFTAAVVAVTLYELSYHPMEVGERVVTATIVFGTFILFLILSCARHLRLGDKIER
jgi:hypothetical protein